MRKGKRVLVAKAVWSSGLPKGVPRFLSVIVVCYYSIKPGKYRCIMLFQFVLLRLTNSFGDGRGQDIRKKEKKKRVQICMIFF